MPVLRVATGSSTSDLPPTRRLAWAIAECAVDPVAVQPAVARMIGNRLIDNAGVAAASLAQHPVATARMQGALHTARQGSTIYGLSSHRRVSPDWAAWANAVAISHLDCHDAFVAADEAHPAEAIVPILAVAQHCGRTGCDLVRGIAAAYEIQVALTRGICLHAHRVDSTAHLVPAAAAGIGAALALPVEVISCAVQIALHGAFSARSAAVHSCPSARAFASAYAARRAIEAVDRAMRGETEPAAYEGPDGLVATRLGGSIAEYRVVLPARGEPKRAILDTYPRQHPAAYEAQAFIDLAFRLRRRLAGTATVREIVIRTNLRTHMCIGTGGQVGDGAVDQNRTLDRCLPHIVAVALQDGVWDHTVSCAPERARSPATAELRNKIRTVAVPEWTERFHATDPDRRGLGGEIAIHLNDGSVIEDRILFADAHPGGAKPFKRRGYVEKFRRLASDLVPDFEQDRFLHTVDRLERLSNNDLFGLTLTAPAGMLPMPVRPGLFEGVLPTRHAVPKRTMTALRLIQTA